MSEKRFELVSVCGDFGIIDTSTDDVWFFETYESVVKVRDKLNEQDRKIRQLEVSIERREEQISIIKNHCLKFLTDEQFGTIRRALEDE